jgi:25S rRNA (cytosine2870-C5)-methyltransferase
VSFHHRPFELPRSNISSSSEQVVNYALSRRPNVKLVDTTIPFGKEGFTSYMGKTFDQSLKLTRRY